MANEPIRKNYFLTIRSHGWAMYRQTIILSSLLIACGIFGALYSLAQTHSGWSFIFLCAVMAIAITATASWYIAEDQPPPPPITPPSS
jgi:hypothetical protein